MPLIDGHGPPTELCTVGPDFMALGVIASRVMEQMLCDKDKSRGGR